MLSSGLYRVKSCEQMSIMLHMGMQGTFTRTGANAGTFTLTESDDDLRGNSTIVIPAGTKLHLGAQGFRNATQVVSMTADATFSSGVLTITTTETIDTIFSSAKDATLMYVPSASEDSTDNSLLLDKRSFGILESPSSSFTVYDLCFGISLHPKYVGRDGDITDSDLAPSNLNIQLSGALANMAGLGMATGDVNGRPADTLSAQAGGHGAVAHGSGGYAMGMVRYGGMISPKIRVEQPVGVVRFATDLSKGTDDTSNRLLNKTGFLTAADTSISDMNQRYRIITNSEKQDGSLPTFQLLQDKLEPMRDPHILMLGLKIILEEVSETEVREMIRRSGRFNYKIMEDPVEAFKLQSDNVTGPANGWKELVENQRGRKMSFQDYKDATENITSQTMNQLYGTGPSRPNQIRQDPRRMHRRG